MPQEGEIKKWMIRVSGGVGTTIILLALVGQVSHYARSADTEERSLENEQRNAEQDKALEPILKIVEELGKRAAAEDAALEQDAIRCRQCKILDPNICGDAGGKVCE